MTSNSSMMQALRTKFIKIFKSESNAVFQGMVTLFLGSGLGRIVSILSMPLLTRLYNPEDFGLLALYTSIISILAPILTFRYAQAIPRPRTDLMALHLLLLCLQLIFVQSIFITVFLLLFGQNIFTYFNIESLYPLWWLIVFGSAGIALHELFSLWAIRKRQYTYIAHAQFIQSFVGNLVKIIFGIFSLRP